ncbi:MAG: hypothetical protein WA989_14865 [Henriciella sp.]|uniref:hypothetical protein n=1 Tax=Henriciella sp. TaxID=1968823 RepID=UPI003C78D4F0
MKSFGVIFLAGLASFAVLLLWPNAHPERKGDDLVASDNTAPPVETASLAH